MSSKDTKNDFLFHPFEIGFCGYSGSGKTTLIAKLLERLRSEYKVGFIKNDAHRFDMDREGKDTNRAWKSGASTVTISDRDHHVFMKKGPSDRNEVKLAFQDCDFVLVEGFKNSSIRKFVLIDSENEILKSQFDNVIGWIGKEERSSVANQPYFQRDDVDAIWTQIKLIWEQDILSTPLYGLVLTGGRSTRMEREKALLKYAGVPAAERGFQLLSQVCQRAFLSSRSGQWEESVLSKFPQIHDQISSRGPLAGIVSAMQSYPKAAWLVIACDLPFLEPDTLEYLLKNRNPFKLATCFESEHGDFPEPLCTVYEPKAYPKIMQFLGLGYQCPRKILNHSEINLLKQINARSLDNVNFPSEYQRVLGEFGSTLEAR